MKLAPQKRWTLRHGWSGETDLDALRHCGQVLQEAGVSFAGLSSAEGGDALKMHGFEIVEAVEKGAPALRSLDAIASALKWRQRVPAFMRRYCVHDEHWCGIPMGIHRGNLAWVNPAIAEKIGGQVPATLPELVEWLLEARKLTRLEPLAISAVPWHIGALFESVVLSAAGSATYRQAFEEMRPAAWLSDGMTEALRMMLTLRDFVSDDQLMSGGRNLRELLYAGDVALQVMGDWVRASAGNRLLEWAVPGTSGKFVAIMDFFVPLAGSAPDIADEVARVLTAPDFQVGFARSKGCMPAVVDAWDDCDPLRMRLLSRADRAVFPSLTFDQCCTASKRDALLQLVAQQFVHRLDAKECTQALAAIVAQG